MAKGRFVAMPAVDGFGTQRVKQISRLAVGAAAILAVALAPGADPALAGQFDPSTPVVQSQDSDWLTDQVVSTLGLGFPVLVPASVPAPFSGEPAITASGDYYSLYWMNPGGDPTFLQITGTVGGQLPAGSPYDLNNELSINASVQGYDAIHDVTPIYDQVWWIANGVLYNVDSKNLSYTDSLSLADSLVHLSSSSSGSAESGDTTAPADPSADSSTDGSSESSAPTADAADQNANAAVSVDNSVASGGTVDVNVSDAINVDLVADGGVFDVGGGTEIDNLNSGTFQWQAPEVDADTTITFTISSPSTGETIDTAQILVTPPAGTTSSNDASSAPETSTAAQPTAAPVNDQDQSSGATEPTAVPSVTTPTPASASSPTDGQTTRSDGTDGPPPPVVGGDGTGGSQTIELPRGTGPNP